MPHYFSEKQTSASKEQEISATLLGSRLTFVTDSGMFSLTRIDPGSRLLIEAAELPQQGSVLDLGCGYGAVGIALARAHPALAFVLVDVNRRAVSCAKLNARRNKAQNVEVKDGDLYTGLGSFSAIVCNPPQSAGKDICLRIIAEATGHLPAGGSLQIVVRHNKGGKALMAAMQDSFGNVTTIAKKAGYHVYLSRHE
ncbi:MAG: methyltransferase [Nanoarchaeota archaeon]